MSIYEKNIKNQVMRVIISGGGTGGHIYPGIAIADAISKIAPHTNFLFVGAEGKMEMEKVPKAGYQIEGLPIRGLQRSLSLENLKFPFRLLGSLKKARQILKSFEPDVVVGTGGYASGAVLQIATLMNIPTLIQEQNGYAGLTNKLLANQVDAICVAYPDMEKYFPKEKLIFTGNPVRSDLNNLPSPSQEDYDYFGLHAHKPTLLITGGSGGAKTINYAILDGIESLISSGYQVIWQTGKYYFSQIQKQLQEKGTWKSNKESGNSLWVNDFIYDMKKAYQCADVVIGRAGALTISELALVRKPSILVPSPNVAEDHQTKNAFALATKKAAMLIKDDEAAERLVPSAVYLLGDKEERQRLINEIGEFARPDAAEQIAEKVIDLFKNF